MDKIYRIFVGDIEINDINYEIFIDEDCTTLEFDSIPCGGVVSFTLPLTDEIQEQIRNNKIRTL